MQTATQLGRYRIEAELGRGAMGIVYRAFDPLVERAVAVKTIRLDGDDPDGFGRRLKREAKAVGQLEHPNIVTLYDVGECDGIFYLAMQYLAGESLWHRMRRQPELSLKEVQEVMRQISCALDYAHEGGVVHRDVKPANIIMTPENVVKLTDFGIAKLLDGGTLSSGLIVGTPSYMSPEQALGQALDGRSDLFSLGAILYELLTGEKAFPGQNATSVIYKIIHETPTPITALRPNLCSALEPIVKKSLAKNPDERFQSCGELQLHLEAALASMTPVRTAVPSLRPEAQDLDSSSARAASAGVQAPVSAERVGSSAAARQQGPLDSRTARAIKQSGTGLIGAVISGLLVLAVLKFRPAKARAISTDRSDTKSGETAGGVGAHPSAPEKSDSAPGDHQAGPPPSEKEGFQVTLATANTSVPELAELRLRPRIQNDKTSVQKVPPNTADSFDSWLVAGDVAFQSSRYNQALAAYLKAYGIRRSDAGVRRKIATTLTLLGRPDEAQKY